MANNTVMGIVCFIIAFLIFIFVTIDIRKFGFGNIIKRFSMIIILAFGLVGMRLLTNKKKE